MPWWQGRTGRTLDSLFGDGKLFGFPGMTYSSGRMQMQFAKMPMDALSMIVASYLREPVIDMTGLEGRYQVTLDSSPAEMRPDASGMASEPSGASLISAVQRLGHRLERRKAPIALLVVDHVKQVPKEN